MRLVVSIYFYIFITLVQYFGNVHSDTDSLIDISKLKVPDVVKKILLNCQFQAKRVEFELIVLRNDLETCYEKSEISMDLRTVTEESNIRLEYRAATPITIHIVDEKTTQTKKKNQLQSCSDINSTISGVYRLSNYVDGGYPLEVYCDFDTQDGGWTIIQRRINGVVNFNRPWQDYKNGFGEVYGEYWLGLEHIHKMTTSEPQELLIILEDFDNQTRWAKYDLFVVGNEIEQYSIKLLGAYTGDAGESLSFHLLDKFSTLDVDNDTWDQSCALQFKSGWWFNSCLTSNLNGIAIKANVDKTQYYRGIIWQTFRDAQYSLKSTKMMLRPKSYIVPKEKIKNTNKK